jgi:tetratricopeptide (TPR) repeat protein
MSDLHARALQLADVLGQEPEPPLVWSLAMAALTQGEWETARSFGEQLRARAGLDGDELLHVESDYILGIAAYWRGDLERARTHFEAALARFRPANRRAHVLRYGQDPELLVRTRLAHALWLLGDEEEADRQLELGLAAAGESSHAYSRAVALIFAAVLAADRSDAEALRRHASSLEPYLEDAPAQVVLPAALLSGYLDVRDGRTATGLERARKAHDRVVDSWAPAPGVPGVASRLLLECYVRAGDASEGLALADDALSSGRGAELWEAEIRRLRAELLQALGGSEEEVTDELRHALSVAERQRAVAFEQRIRETLAERTLGHDRAI